MKKLLLVAAAAALAAVGAAKADPVDLSAYADANGFVDVQALTCGQLANRYQEDACPRDLVQRLVQRPCAQALRRLQEGPDRRAPGDRILQGASG